jgi:tetratricopeptide (TPR) repeat protein
LAGPIAALGADAKLLAQEGIRLLEEHDFHQAIQSFEGALAIDPAARLAREGLAKAHAGLGVEYVNSGELAPARDAFEKSLRIGDEVTARFGLGYLDFLEMRDGPARDHLERALKKSPNDARTHKLLALIDYRRGETSSALRRISEAARLDPKDQESEALRAGWSREEEVRKGLKESTTRHFLVRFDPSFHPEAVREMLADLEGIHEALGRALGHWPSRQVPVLLLKEADFYAATGSHHWVGGVYDGQIKVPVQEAESRSGAARGTLVRTLRHEYAHVVVKDLYPGCPNWLNEGLAQYFELEEGKEPGRDTPERSARREKLRQELKANAAKRIRLEKVPARLWEIIDASLARWTYLEGLGFVSYLVEKHRAFRLRLLLSAARREGSLARAFEVTYGAPLSELENRWWQTIE